MLRVVWIPMVLAGTAYADAGQYGHMMDWGIGFMFGPVLWLVVLGLIVAGIIWFVRNFDTNGVAAETAGKSDPLDTLKMRLAKGEIDEAEFVAKKELLGN